MFYLYLSEAIMWQVEFDQVGEVRQSIRVDGGDTTEGGESLLFIIKFIILIYIIKFWWGKDFKL